ncbi:MAG TPA: DNA alkylation repair protein [Pseudomonadota bacterium]|nr:DNA alkylation repair protein [Pseudomonadota bacterium]
MNVQEAMSALEGAQNAPTKKTYLRHGAKEPLFGVRTADLAKIKARIKVDHALALALFATGNADARLLAMQIADPGKLDEKTADAWLKAACWPMDTYYLGALLVRSAIWRRCMARWMAHSDEWVQSCGYGLLSQCLKEDPDSISDAEAEAALQAIEAGIHGAKNRARSNMNTALISIGTYKPSLRAAALAAARRMGPVEVDHGDTDCKTPDAAAYILKAGAHFDSKSAGRKAGQAGSAAKPKAAPAAAKKAPATAKKGSNAKPAAAKPAAAKPAAAKKAPASRSRAK